MIANRQTAMIKKSEHKKLLDLVNPLVDYMNANGFTFLIFAGKDGTSTQQMRGTESDLEGMMFGFAKRHKSFAAITRNVAQDIKTGVKE